MCTRHPRSLSRRTLLRASASLGVVLLAGCGRTRNGIDEVIPREIDRSSACALDGMLLADYPGPKAQIHYAGRSEPDFLCDTVEMFNLYLNPEVIVPIRAVFVQDMGAADWDAPFGHWIDAREAWYVHGSSRRGAMGPTIASFATEQSARDFAAEHGGTVARFDEIKPEQVILDGGALHDTRM